ncbi:HIG1 domain-containing protein [Candidatus Tisiphia endosymbiont of Nemotelus uliginosus]|uniref:HIG1 domain-containing protein n=1 Tax=Candidatus Tisiphia endosymbiont of Nemotelus uliginosus TaxID=3077926 RepID=UPI0035C8EBB3
MLYILIALSLTSLVLVIGLIGMIVGGKFEKKFSSKLMSLRVLLQAITVCLLAFLYLSK